MFVIVQRFILKKMMVQVLKMYNPFWIRFFISHTLTYVSTSIFLAVSTWYLYLVENSIENVAEGKTKRGERSGASESECLKLELECCFVVVGNDDDEMIVFFSSKFQKDPGSLDKMYTRQGYLFLMEKSKYSK